MTDADSSKPLQHVLERFLERARHDPQQVELLRELALTILRMFPASPAASEEPERETRVAETVAEPVAEIVVETVAEPVAEPVAEIVAETPAEPVDNPVAETTSETVATPVVQLPAGTVTEPGLEALSPPAKGPTPHTKAPRQQIALSALPARMRLKAGACSWLAEHGYTHDPVALGERRVLKEKARAAQCDLWMLDTRYVNPSAPEAFRLLAANYEATAGITELWQATPEATRSRELIKSVARFQAALRCAVAAAHSPHFFDEDQRTLFHELRRQSDAARIRVFGLALSDVVAPQTVTAHLEQLAGLQHKQAQAEAQQKTRQKAFGRIAYHVGNLQKRPRDPAPDWQTVAKTVEALITSGVPESDERLYEALAPAAPLLPAATPHRRLERILGRSVETARKKVARPHPLPEEQAPEVRRVADLVRGRKLVIIGGDPDPQRTAQYEAALGCDVDWLSSKPHDSPHRFKRRIQKRKVLLVLLLVRWSSHVFKEVNGFCKATGKHLIYVPHGYNIKQLAQAILEQAEKRLEQAQHPQQNPG